LLLVLMRRISSPGWQSAAGIFCFFVTFFLIGLWHGRTSEFIFFGFLQGGGVAVNKSWQVALTSLLGRKRYKSVSANAIYEGFGRGLTFSWFALTLYWFWGSWSQLRAVLAGIGLRQWLEVWTAIWLAATVALALWELLRAGLLAIRIFETPVFLSRYARVVYATALGFTSLLMILLLNQPAPDIVYKAF
jgi:alginate O-acetyltransferase complex protein AlgI